MLKKGTQKSGPERGTQKGYSNRVAQNGYSNRGAQTKGTERGPPKRGPQKGALNTGTQKGVLKRGCSQRGAQKGISIRVLNKGYSRIFNGAEKLLRVRAAVFAGCWRAVHDSVGHPSVESVRHGTVEYSRGTHGVLTGCSRGQWIGRSGVHRRLGVGRRHAVQRMCVAPRRVL